MIRHTCETCVKGMNNNCDNYDMKPIRWCYVATDEERMREYDALEASAESRREKEARK
jgi:hypothetical protein